MTGLKRPGDKYMYLDMFKPKPEQPCPTEKLIMIADGVRLTPFYWDCECEVAYIHKHSQAHRCSICRAVADDQPDSRVDEVEAWLGRKLNKWGE